MGRTRVKNKKTSSTSAADKEGHSVEALFKKAQSLIVQCNYELAQKFAQRILDRAPNNADAKELLGVTQLELGELEEARQVSSILPLNILHMCVPALSCPLIEQNVWLNRLSKRYYLQIPAPLILHLHPHICILHNSVKMTLMSP